VTRGLPTSVIANDNKTTEIISEEPVASITTILCPSPLTKLAAQLPGNRLSALSMAIFLLYLKKYSYI
jgi:hypothetical protein